MAAGGGSRLHFRPFVQPGGRDLLMRIFALLSAVLIGVCLSMQPPVNSEVARRLGSPFAAALLSLTLSAVFLLVIALATGVRVQFASFTNLPPYFIVGGLVGAIFVTGSTILVPLIGAAALVACVVFGQAIGSSAVDQFGLFNLPVQPFDLWKAGGLALMLAGLLLFHFGGR